VRAQYVLVGGIEAIQAARIMPYGGQI